MLDSEPETEKMLHLARSVSFMSSLINKIMSSFHSDFTFEIDF